MNKKILEGYDSFHWICCFLSPFISKEIKEKMQPNDNNWMKIIQTADTQMLLPKLYIALNDHKNIKCQSDELIECLSLTYELNLDRNKRLLNQLKKVIIALNQIGIRPIIIKGAESLIQESSISNGRMMNDIDIWVLERNNWSEIQKALESISYKCEIDINTFDQEKEHHFPPFYNENEPARLELHHRLIRPSLKYLLSEEIIKNRIIYHKKNDLEYGTISDIDCIALSYIQSSHMSVPHFDTGMVPAMKWLDFIERFYNLKNKNKKYIHSRTEFSIIGTNEDIDNQLFTALKKYFDFPYEGKLNNKYIDQKELINNNPYKAEIGYLFKKLKTTKIINLNRPFKNYINIAKNLISPNKKIWK